MKKIKFILWAVVVLLLAAGCNTVPVKPELLIGPPAPPLPTGVETKQSLRSAPHQTLLEDTNLPTPIFNIGLAWDYDYEERTNVTFWVHGNADASAPEPWDTLGEPTTNLTARVEMTAQRYFFYITASNFWSGLQSVPSNINGTPAPPRVVEKTSLTIK